MFKVEEVPPYLVMKKQRPRNRIPQGVHGFRGSEACCWGTLVWNLRTCDDWVLCTLKHAIAVGFPLSFWVAGSLWPAFCLSVGCCCTKKSFRKNSKWCRWSSASTQINSLRHFWIIFTELDCISWRIRIWHNSQKCHHLKAAERLQAKRTWLKYASVIHSLIHFLRDGTFLCSKESFYTLWRFCLWTARVMLSCRESSKSSLWSLWILCGWGG